MTWLTAGAPSNPSGSPAKEDRSGEGEDGGRYPVMRTRIRELTGVRTKVVWLSDRTGGRDPFAIGSKLALMGVDTDDPRGVRELVRRRKNFSRPLIAPDGSTVVYSDREGETTKDGKPRPVIFAVDWDTGEERKLRTGFALDLWRNPADGAVWVYALKRISSGTTANTNGREVIRFRLDDPAKEEPVWDRAQVTSDNFQLNRDGTAASGLVPWPNAGRIDFATGEFIRHTNGCWPSMAPDNSGLSWVFDGAHENLRMFLPGRAGPWRVNLSSAEGIGGREVYHPRWSNHPSFVVFTGPYQGRVRSGGRGVEVVIGRFNADVTAVEATVMLKSRDRNPDIFPDLWLEGGETVSLDPATLGPAELRDRKPVEPAAAWQVDPQGLVFQWENALASNRVASAEGARTCSVEPRRYARFDRHFAMLTDGGWFEGDAESAAAAAAGLAGGPWSVEFSATLPQTAPEGGVILAAGGELIIRQTGADLGIQRRDRAWRVADVLPADGAVHVAAGANAADALPVVIINGIAQTVGEAQAGPRRDGTGLTFGALPGGDAPWGGILEAVAVHAAPPAPGRAAAHAGWWVSRQTGRKSPERTVVRAERIEASPVLSVRDIAPYLRAWTTASYRRIEVISGPDPGPGFTVTHWTILDRQLIPGALPDAGAERTLTLEPLDAHPELESERGSDEVSTDALPGYFDVSSPGSATP